MIRLDIDSREVVKNTARMERVRKTAIPNAVRNTLNNAAFDVKQNTMPARAAATFEKRQPNFFRANSRVEKASGNDIMRMQSVVGFKPLSGTNHAVDDLEQQEHGGNIGGRSYVPLPKARAGNSWNKNVRRSARISDVRKKVVDANDSKGKNDKEKYTRAAIHAGKGGWVLGNKVNGKGNRMLYQIRSIVRRGKHMKIKSVAMHALKKGRHVNPAATHFMQKATEQTGKKLETFYIKNIQRELAKIK